MSTIKPVQNPSSVNPLDEKTILDLFANQEKITEWALTAEGREKVEYRLAMDNTCDFLNSCRLEDVKTIIHRDLRENGATFIYVLFKASNEQVLIDIFHLQKLKPELRERIRNKLEPHFRSLKPSIRSQVDKATKLKASGLFNIIRSRFKPLISGALRKGTSPMEHIDESFELRRWHHILKDPNHELYQEALKWLDTSNWKDTEDLEEALNDQSAADTIGKQPRLLPGMDNLRDNHYLSYVREALENPNLYTYWSLSQLKSAYEMGHFRWKWDKAQSHYRKLLENPIPEEDEVIQRFQTVVLELVSRARQVFRLTANHESPLFLSIDVEMHLGIMTDQDRSFQRRWIEENFCNWFILVHRIQKHLQGWLPKDPRIKAFIERYSLLPGHTFTKQRIDNKAFYKFDLRLEDLSLEIDEKPRFVLQECLKIYNKARRLLQDMPNFYLKNFDENDTQPMAAFKDIERWSKMVQKARRLTQRAYRRCFHDNTLDLENLRKVIHIQKEGRAPFFQSMDLAAFSITSYEDRYRQIRQQDSPNKAIKLLALLEELRLLPGLTRWNEILEKRSYYFNDEDERDLSCLFVIKNNNRSEALCHKTQAALTETVLQDLKHDLPVSDRLLFEALQLTNYYSEDLREALNLLEQESTYNLRESDRLRYMDLLESLERHVVEALELFSRKQVLSLLERLKETFALDPLNLSFIQKRFESNHDSLEQIHPQVCEIYAELNTVYGIGSYYGMRLSPEDLESLKRNFGMVDGLAINKIKKFAQSYKERGQSNIALFENILHNPEEAPSELKELITRTHVEKYRAKRVLSNRVKLLFMYHFEDYRQKELKHLALFLNYCIPNMCRKQSTYQLFIKMFQTNLDSEQSLQMLRPIVGALKTLRFTYKPISFQTLFKCNIAYLFRDLQIVVGDKLKLD